MIAVELQHGAICKNCCGFSKCRDIPTAADPIQLKCFFCNETGCSECNQTGRITITGCPLRTIDEGIWDIIELADLYEKGLPPNAGGSLDQMRAFIVAFDIISKTKKQFKIDGMN